MTSTKTHFIITGDTVKLIPGGAISLSNELAPKTYAVECSPAGEYSLRETTAMTVPSKLYGETPDIRADRIINTFRSRGASTGVLLSGEKGSGKTLLTKVLSAKLLATGTPVLLINEPHYGPGFNKFITDLTTPSLIVFDEFEKIYDKDDQQQLLTLLDGTATCKHLFVLTTNADSISRYFLNRPGRIFYTFRYGSLTEEVIKEYTAENLKNQDNTDGLLMFTRLFNSFNFDMLQALVEEMNRYNETATESAAALNASPKNEFASYDVAVFMDGKRLEDSSFHPQVYNCSPISNPFAMHFYTIKGVKPVPDYFKINASTLTAINEGGALHYEMTEGKHKYEAVFTKQLPFTYNGIEF